MPNEITPRKIRLEVSSYCQLRCPSCPTTTKHIDPAVGSGFLKLSSFKALIDSRGVDGLLAYMREHAI